MRIIWDEKKNQQLISERGLSFEEVASCILRNEIVDILKNPARNSQFYFVIKLREYIHLVPFLVNENEEIILKTVFPSRKFHRKYEGRK